MKNAIIFLLFCALQATAFSDSIAVVVDTSGGGSRYGTMICRGDLPCAGNMTAQQLASRASEIERRNARRSMASLGAVGAVVVVSLLIMMWRGRDTQWINA